MHVAHLMPVRKLTQRACGSLIMGLAALTGKFMPPLEHLAEWFAVVTNSDTYDTTEKDTSHVADVILRLYVGSARLTDTPCLDWALDNPWSLVLCDKKPFSAPRWRSSLIVHFRVSLAAIASFRV